MAGSWDHITTDDGKFRSQTFTDLIENLGDAHEAAEECFGMVQYLADRLALASGAGGRNSVAADRRRFIREAEKHYKDGVALGGTEEE